MSLSSLSQPAKNIARIVFLIIFIAVFFTIILETRQILIKNGWLKLTSKDKQEFVEKEFLGNLNFEYKISKVVDGDTVKIKRQDGGYILGTDKKEVSVRLIGIDTPETVDPRKPVECYGEEASKYLKKIAQNKVAAIEIDPTQGEFDVYNRLLAYVYIKDSGIAIKNITMLNREMVKEGYAFQYTYKLPYKYKEEFEWLEKYARENYIGLWSSNTCAGLRTPVAPPRN